jgi:hypothetical protein
VNWSEILNAAIDPDSPITTTLMTQMRDNPIASHKYVARTTAVTPVNTTSLADDVDLQFTVDANTAYIFKAVIAFTNSASGNFFRASINGPALSTISVQHNVSGRASTASITGTNPMGSYFTTTLDDPVILDTGGSAAGDDASDLIEGFILTGANSGSVVLRWASGAVPGGDTTAINLGSYIMYHRVDTV